MSKEGEEKEKKREERSRETRKTGGGARERDRVKCTLARSIECAIALGTRYEVAEPGEGCTVKLTFRSSGEGKVQQQIEDRAQKL